ncbi:hypothetical protein [Jeotgalibaca porci]|uniref:hypothetical protein n=1 Tax=Jeotgalibaca porci TaxID=1868793 RepID=UPI0035A04501
MDQLKDIKSTLDLLKSQNQRIGKIDVDSLNEDGVKELNDIKVENHRIKINALKILTKVLIWTFLNSVLFLSLTIFYTFGFINLLSTTHLSGFGVRVLKQFDVGSLITNIFRMSFSAVIISFIILFSIKFLAVWFNIKRSDIRSTMLVVTPILFYIAISFSVVLSMNSDQLSTITSLFAMLVILRVFFKHPIDKIISLINLRIDKLIGKNRKVQQADLNKSVENHEKTNDK